MERGQLGPLAKGRQITGPEREMIAAGLRERYAQGASIRDLMEQTGRSYGWTHRLLREAGVALRGRGGAPPGTAGQAGGLRGQQRDSPMSDPRVALTSRSLRFAAGTFQDMARTRDAAACAREAAAAHVAAATSNNPLLCLARAAWWAAVADRSVVRQDGRGVRTGTAG